MAHTNVGRRGRSGRGGRGGRGRCHSNHEAAHGWGQISIRTNTSGTHFKTNATVSSDTGVQKSIQANTSSSYEINATMSFDTRVQKSIRTNTSGTLSKTNIEVQKSIRTNTSGTRYETNATMSFDTGAQEHELFKWEGLSDVLVHDAWENSMKKRFPDIMSKARGESVKLAQATYNGALVEKYGSDRANHPIYDDNIWKKYAGDDMKGGVFGWGCMSDPQYTLTGTLSTTRCTGSSSSGSKDVQNYLDSVRGELKEELMDEVKVDLKEEMKDLKEKMKVGLKEEMKNELKEEMREELKEEIREKLKEEMRAEIQDMLVDYGIKSCVTHQTKTKQGNASGHTS
ncbi:transposase, Ptta/En/Spm [Tanacetum coccineum]